MTAHRRALAAIGAVTLAAALSTVASAQGTGSPVPVNFVVPTQDQVLTVSNPTIRAYVSVSPVADQPQRLLVSVTGAANVTKEVMATSECQEVEVPVALSRNGSYQVTVTADVPAPPAIDGECQGGTVTPRQFFVAAPPAPPGGVKAARDPARAVNVSWAKNPEPDVVSYRVQRSTGAGPFQQVGEVPGTAFRDGTVPSAGALRYQVLAVRTGKTAQETVVSAPSAAVTVGEPGGPTGGGGSYRASGSSEPVFTGPPQPGAGASEGGFDDRLPYQPVEEAELTELGTNETSNNVHRSMGFVAGGLLALVTFFFLRCLRAEAARQPLAG